MSSAFVSGKGGCTKVLLVQWERSVSVSSRLMKPSTRNQIGDSFLIISGFWRRFLHQNSRQTFVRASSFVEQVEYELNCWSSRPLYYSAKQTAPYIVYLFTACLLRQKDHGQCVDGLARSEFSGSTNLRRGMQYSYSAWFNQGYWWGGEWWYNL